MCVFVCVYVCVWMWVCIQVCYVAIIHRQKLISLRSYHYNSALLPLLSSYMETKYIHSYHDGIAFVLILLITIIQPHG